MSVRVSHRIGCPTSKSLDESNKSDTNQLCEVNKVSLCIQIVRSLETLRLPQGKSPENRTTQSSADAFSKNSCAGAPTQGRLPPEGPPTRRPHVPGPWVCGVRAPQISSPAGACLWPPRWAWRWLLSSVVGLGLRNLECPRSLGRPTRSPPPYPRGASST